MKYVIITPARNEAAFLEKTIHSVIRQTILPEKWVIVSDGSTDGTDDIVRRYADVHEWIDFVRMPERKERHFVGKVTAFRAGWERVKNLNYDLIVSLDADITFEVDYFAFLLDRFSENPRLGVGGTPFIEGAYKYDYRFTSIEHVSGACQVFRRNCYDSIGGYIPIMGGGIDLLAVLTARKQGWETRTFPEKYCLHHRRMGTAKSSALISRFNDGTKDYAFGAHPLWEVFRTVYQMTKPPYVIGGLALGLGYLLSLVRRIERPITEELMRFRRQEQMQRLHRFLGHRTT